MSGQTIQSTIDAITDESASNPYTVIVPCGTYTEQITMAQYISLVGMGSRCTIITNSSQVVEYASDTNITDLSIVYTGTSDATDSDGALNNMYIHNAYIEALTGRAINFSNAGANNTWNVILSDMVIKASSGIVTAGSDYTILDNVIIQLYGQSSGVDHIGIQYDASSRMKMYGGRIYSSWLAAEWIDGVGDNVYAIYVPSANTNTVLPAFYDVSIMVRSEDDVNVNAVRQEGTHVNTSVRLMGGRAQTESGGGGSDSIALFQSGASRGIFTKDVVVSGSNSHYSGKVFGMYQTMNSGEVIIVDSTTDGESGDDVIIRRIADEGTDDLVMRITDAQVADITSFASGGMNINAAGGLSP